MYSTQKVPEKLLEKFKECNMSNQEGFFHILSNWEKLSGLMPTPIVQPVQSSFRASDIRKQIDLALESERERIAIQVLLLFQEHTSFSGYFESGKTNQKYDLDLSVNVPHDVLTQMKEQLE